MKTEKPYPPSWYAASATPLSVQPALQGRIDADVCILGAGYTGLAAALELAGADYCLPLPEIPFLLEALCS